MLAIIAKLTEKIKELPHASYKKIDNLILLPSSKISCGLVKIADRLQDIYRNPHNHMHKTKDEMYKCCMIEPYAISSELYYAHVDTIPNPPWQGK